MTMPVIAHPASSSLSVHTPSLVRINIKVASPNPAHSGVYSIQHYMIKCVNNLRQVGGFLRIL